MSYVYFRPVIPSDCDSSYTLPSTQPVQHHAQQALALHLPPDPTEADALWIEHRDGPAREHHRPVERGLLQPLSPNLVPQSPLVISTAAQAGRISSQWRTQGSLTTHRPSNAPSDPLRDNPDSLHHGCSFRSRASCPGCADADSPRIAVNSRPKTKGIQSVSGNLTSALWLLT